LNIFLLFLCTSIPHFLKMEACKSLDSESNDLICTTLDWAENAAMLHFWYHNISYGRCTRRNCFQEISLLFQCGRMLAKS
jgi:hypothetical protein